mgnify:CR=1 FL=1
MDKLKFKVVSNGTIAGTYLLDQYGNLFDDVLSVNIELNGESGIPMVTLKVYAPDIEWVSKPAMIKANIEPPTRVTFEREVEAPVECCAGKECACKGVEHGEGVNPPWDAEAATAVTLGWDEALDQFGFDKDYLLDALGTNLNAAKVTTDPNKLQALKANRAFLIEQLQKLT